MTRTEYESAGTHWQQYYAAGGIPEIPSQFSVFIANEFPDYSTVLEFGSGNGRDSLFFARHGFTVFGMDLSQAAVDLCNETARRDKVAAKFTKLDVADPQAFATVSKALEDAADTPLIIYARFFIHAIDDDAQENLLSVVSTVLASRSGVFAVEFRTPRDEQQQKVTPAHYRRFVSSNAFAVAASKHGLVCDYCVEGFGMAKFKNDDAHVTRMIFSNVS